MCEYDKLIESFKQGFLGIEPLAERAEQPDQQDPIVWAQHANVDESNIWLGFDPETDELLAIIEESHLANTVVYQLQVNNEYIAAYRTVEAAMTRAVNELFD